MKNSDYTYRVTLSMFITGDNPSCIRSCYYFDDLNVAFNFYRDCYSYDVIYPKDVYKIKVSIHHVNGSYVCSNVCANVHKGRVRYD